MLSASPVWNENKSSQGASGKTMLLYAAEESFWARTMNVISPLPGACNVVPNAIVEPNASITVESISKTRVPSGTPKYHAIRVSNACTRTAASFSTKRTA